MEREAKPCARFRKADGAARVAHVNSGKCQKCLALARYFERESRRNSFLRAHRNHAVASRWLKDHKLYHLYSPAVVAASWVAEPPSRFSTALFELRMS
jgi:hypothetical protein